MYTHLSSFTENYLQIVELFNSSTQVVKSVAIKREIPVTSYVKR